MEVLVQLGGHPLVQKSMQLELLMVQTEGQAIHQRMNMLLSIAKQYSIIYDFLKRVQVANVTTAIPLTKELEMKVMDKIVELTGNKANLENSVNPSILGGFILRVGDVQYDASISNHLNELKKEFDNSHFIPKI